MPRNPHPHQWPAAKEERFRTLWNDPNVRITDILAEFGTSWGNIKGKSIRMNLPPKAQREPRPKWTPAENALLEAAVRAGKSWTEISSIIGKPNEACRKRASGAGFRPPPPPAPPVVAVVEVKRPATAAWQPPRSVPIPPPRECQYPLWEDETPRAKRTACAGPIWRGSYCLDHWGLCYEEPAWDRQKVTHDPARG